MNILDDKMMSRNNNAKESRRYSVAIDKTPKLKPLFIASVEKLKLNLIAKANKIKVVEIKIKKSLFLKFIKKQNIEAIKGRNSNRYGKVGEGIDLQYKSLM